jgi:hypothetical protein
MNQPTHLRTQLRLLLEQRCSEVGRETALEIGPEIAHFALFMFEFGVAGLANAAYTSTANLTEARAAVTRWLAEGTPARPGALRGPARSAATTSIATWLQTRCMAGTGYAFLLFDATGPYGLVSSADPADVRATLHEWLDLTDPARPPNGDAS